MILYFVVAIDDLLVESPDQMPPKVHFFNATLKKESSFGLR